MPYIRVARPLSLALFTVRGKGHLHTCIAGRKDNLRCSFLRKDNPKTTIKILVFKNIKDCKEIRKVS
jgi:hypothetical protein